MRLKLAVAVLGAAAVALVFSGCFVFSGIDYSKIKLRPGPAKHSVSKVTGEVFPSGGTKKALFFVLIGLPNGATDGDTSDDALAIKGNEGVLDPAKRIFSHPKPLTPNSTIRDYLLNNSGQCGSFQLNTSDTKYQVLATNAAVDDQGKTSTAVQYRYALKQTQPSHDIEPANVLSATGFWVDKNHDGQINDGSGTFGCTGGAASSIRLKPAPSSKDKSPSKALLRKYTG